MFKHGIFLSVKLLAEYMKIKPLIGVDELILGSSRAEVIDMLGMYNLSKLDEFGGNFKSEEWQYSDLGLELSFDSEDDYVLSTITVTSEIAELDGVKPIGLTELELLKQFPSAYLDDDFEENGRNLVISEWEMAFWVQDNKVVNLTIFPLFEEDNETVLWPSIS